MTAIRRLAPIDEATSSSTTLIDRYAGRTDHASIVRFALPRGTPLAGVEIALIDTTGRAGPLPFPQGSSMWHVLWVRDEPNGSVAITLDDREERWPIAPGDTVGVPQGAALVPAGGQLAIAVTVAGEDVPLASPTHGTETYFGYNRLTEAFRIGAVRLRRWKLTQPLALAEHYPDPAVVLALARPVVIRTATRVDHLAQGEMALMDPATGPIAMPDGLGYLLTVHASVHQ